MRRRELIVGVIAVSVFGKHAGAAQQPRGRGRIGVLLSGPDLPDSFRQQLRALGYADDDVEIVVRAAHGHLERLAALVAELVRVSPDVIVAVGPAVAAARQATSTIPIVMVNVADPVAAGFVASLARPGGNVTGLANLAQDTTGKRLELLKTIAPSVRRIAILLDPGNPGNVHQLQAAQQAAPSLGIEALPVEAASADAVPDAFAAIARERADAVFVAEDPFFLLYQEQTVELVRGSKLPAIFQSRGYVDLGGLMSYGTNIDDLYRRAAYYCAKILKGAKSADLPVEQPTKFELVINLKTAKALGLSVPQSLLARADEVIE